MKALAHLAVALLALALAGLVAVPLICVEFALKCVAGLFSFVSDRLLRACKEATEWAEAEERKRVGAQDR